MKFFSEPELSEYYGKPFHQISPTDTPLDEFVNGQETISCFECGDELDVVCQGVKYDTPMEEFREIAYCEACEIEFFRNREPVVETIDYQHHYHRTDEREEYVCSDCGSYHGFTVPVDDGWEYETDPTFHSYEQISLQCPCGKSISVDSLDFPMEVSCDKCSRVYEFEVSSE